MTTLSHAEQFLVPRMSDITYPWNGLIAQAAEARNSDVNGTLGVFTDEEQHIGILPAVHELVNLPAGKITAYAPSHGLADLRACWKERLQKMGHCTEEMSQHTSLPVVTQGLTSGLSLCAKLFLQPGQSELILPTPFWPNYRLIFNKIEATDLRTYDLFAEESPGHFTLNLNGLSESLRASHGKVEPDLPLVVLLNLPHNPTGYTYTREEATKVKDVFVSFLQSAPERRLVVVIDDAYLGFHYSESCLPHSMLSLLGGAHKNLLCAHLSGATKEVYAWGLRVGFITFANPKLEEEGLVLLADKAAALIRGTLSNVSMVSQQLALASIQDKRTPIVHAQFYQTLKGRYTACRRELERPEIHRIFDVIPFNSGYFFTLRLKPGQGSAQDMRKRLLTEHSVGVVALDERLVRIAFSSIPTKDYPRLFDALISCARSVA